MEKNVLIVVCLILFGILVFCLCCYKVTNLLYQLFTLDREYIEDHDIVLDKSATLGAQPPTLPMPRTAPSSPTIFTPRCSRHSLCNSVGHSLNMNQMNQYNERSENQYSSRNGRNGYSEIDKESLPMVNLSLNQYPSISSLRQDGTSTNYKSFDNYMKPLPQYHAPPQPPPPIPTKAHHRKSNGVGSMGVSNPLLLQHSYPSLINHEPHQHSPSQNQAIRHSHCCTNLPGSHVHSLQHLATLRRCREPQCSHQRRRNNPSQWQEMQDYSQPHGGIGHSQPRTRTSCDNLELGLAHDIGAVFHRDTHLERL